ncbi:hypothetical protein IV102_06115 [bacterium]|nr:hypothetical protein [bacterium]
MKNQLGFIALGLWVVTVGVFAWFFVKGYTTTGSDHRRQILLSPQEKDMVLGEMRAMLSALNGVMGALAENDNKKAALAARTAGMGMAVDVSPALMAKLPADFKMLGMGTHKQFDEFANQLDGGMTAQHAMKIMNNLTNNCVACHQGNRF